MGRVGQSKAKCFGRVAMLGKGASMCDIQMKPSSLEARRQVWSGWSREQRAGPGVGRGHQPELRDPDSWRALPSLP